jgi:hypothetical protein
MKKLNQFTYMSIFATSLFTIMNSQTYSRDYLQSIPQQRKEQAMDGLVQGIIQNIRTAAAVGMTSYRYVKPERDSGVRSYPPAPVLTDDEIIAGFAARFPGCKVFYEETWVEVGRDTKKLKKGIVIDWS